MFNTIKHARQNNKRAAIPFCRTALWMRLDAINSHPVNRITPAFQKAVTSKYPKNSPNRSMNWRYNSSGNGFLLMYKCSLFKIFPPFLIHSYCIYWKILLEKYSYALSFSCWIILSTFTSSILRLSIFPSNAIILWFSQEKIENRVSIRELILLLFFVVLSAVKKFFPKIIEKTDAWNESVKTNVAFLIR